jgi:hypothetical protein
VWQHRRSHQWFLFVIGATDSRPVFLTAHSRSTQKILNCRDARINRRKRARRRQVAALEEMLD